MDNMELVRKMIEWNPDFLFLHDILHTDISTGYFTSLF